MRSNFSFLHHTMNPSSVQDSNTADTSHLNLTFVLAAFSSVINYTTHVSRTACMPVRTCMHTCNIQACHRFITSQLYRYNIFSSFKKCRYISSYIYMYQRKRREALPTHAHRLTDAEMLTVFRVGNERPLKKLIRNVKCASTTSCLVTCDF